MVKALFKLCLLALAPIFFLSLSNVLNPLRSSQERFLESFLTEVYISTLKRIEHELQGLSEPEIQLRFDEIVGNFGYDMYLKSFSELKINNKKQQRLREGEIVFVAEDGQVLAYKLNERELIILININKTEARDINLIARGPVYLIRQDLQGIESPIELSQALIQIQDSFGFPFALLSRKESEDQLLKYDGQDTGDGIFWFKDDNGDDVIHVELADLNDGSRVSIGPLNYQNYEWMGAVTSISLILIFTLFGLLLWVFPLWRDHKRLNKAAKDFGLGRLESRVKIRKSSLAANLGNTFNLMADNVQNLIRTNQNLTNAVAHDLRTPLARLRFATEIMALKDCSESEAERYRKTISSSIDSLDYLINQTLMHSRYNRAIDIKNFDYSCFAYVIHEEVEQFNFDHQDLKFVTHIDNDLAVSEQFIDDKALARALSNLLSNAVKHADSLIRVSYFVRDHFFYLQVEDDGKGIPSEDVQFILQPFSQLDNDERDLSNGHGLGLAIVNQIAKWHKGDVLITSSDLGGASVAIKIDSHIKSLE